MILDRIPSSPVRQTLSWGVDVITSHSGAEQRIARTQHPRQRLSYSYEFTDEDSARRYRVAMLNRLNDEHQVPLWFLGSFVTADEGASVIVADFSRWPPMPSSTHHAIITDGTDFELVEYSSLGDSAMELTSALSRDYKRATIAPAWPGKLRDGPTIRRTPIGMTRLDVEIDLSVQWPLAQFVFPDTHDGQALIVDRPLVFGEDSESFQGALSRVDFGNAFAQFTGRSSAAVVKPRRWSTRDLRHWYRLLTVTTGPLQAMLVPTWRADLVIDAQPGEDATSITVTDEPSFLLEYWPSPSHRRLWLHTSAGYLARTVEDVTDNEDGTLTLDLEEALPGTVTIEAISILESVAIGGGVAIEHHPRFSYVDFGIRAAAAGQVGESVIDIPDPGSMGYQVFGASTTFSPPPGAVGPIVFEGVGRGGRRTSSNSYAHSGAGGGEYARAEKPEINAPYNIAVGAGSSQFAQPSFVVDASDDTIMRANGGSPNGFSSGGSGGSGGVGDVLHAGGAGGARQGNGLGTSHAGGGGGASGWRNGPGPDGLNASSSEGGNGGAGQGGDGGRGGDAGELAHPADLPGGGAGGKGNTVETIGNAVIAGPHGDGVVIAYWGGHPLIGIAQIKAELGIE